MREQRDAFAVKGSAQSGVDEQPIDTEFHGASGAASRATKQSRAWKSGAPSGCASAHSALAPDISSITNVRPHSHTGACKRPSSHTTAHIRPSTPVAAKRGREEGRGP